jgi:hypothetical protein
MSTNSQHMLLCNLILPNPKECCVASLQAATEYRYKHTTLEKESDELTAICCYCSGLWLLIGGVERLGSAAPLQGRLALAITPTAEAWAKR